MLDTSRLVGYRRRVSTPVSTPKCSARVRIAMTTSSSEQLPARSPMPLIVHSIWRAPGADGGQAVGHGHAEVVVAMHAEGDPVHAFDVSC